jgi:transcriptional regulator with XRE-family HTH domain
MPRPNRPRTIGREVNLAERIAVERERLGLTYEGLARLMTEAGCPVDKSAIYRIEKGEPRRKVSVDELVALMDVFELSFDELMMPMELVNQKRGQELAAKMRDADDQLDEAAANLVETLIEFLRLGQESPEMSEYVTNLYGVGARPLTTVENERFAHLDRELVTAVLRARDEVLMTAVDLAYFEVKGIRPPKKSTIRRV